MIGEGVAALSFELELSQGLLSVEKQIVQKKSELEEDERRLVKQEGEEVDTDAGKLLIRTKRNGNFQRQMYLSKGRQIIRRKTREFRSSGEGPQGRKHWHDHDTLLRSIDYMKAEIKRLQVLNERMRGKDVDGLDYFQLMILRREIDYDLLSLSRWRVRKKKLVEVSG